MKRGFIYTRWLLALTFTCLMGLLAVGMMTVHSKRTIRTLAANLDRKEVQLEDLERRQHVLDTDLASSLNPEYLKHLIALSNLRLGPPREDHIIVVSSMDGPGANALVKDSVSPSPVYHSRLELANNPQAEGD